MTWTMLVNDPILPFLTGVSNKTDQCSLKIVIWFIHGAIFKNFFDQNNFKLQMSFLRLIFKIPWLLFLKFSPVTQSCPTLCNPMNHSMPGLPVHHQLPEFTQTHVHWVGDAIQPSHPLLSPSPTFNLSQHQGLFKMSQLSASGGQSFGVSASTSVLPMNTQDWSPLGWTGWISLQSRGLSIVFSNTTVQKHQFFRAQLSSQSNSHIHIWPLEKP